MLYHHNKYKLEHLGVPSKGPTEKKLREKDARSPKSSKHYQSFPPTKIVSSRKALKPYILDFVAHALLL